jgi:iron complex transport system permease protein
VTQPAKIFILGCLLLVVVALGLLLGPVWNPSRVILWEIRLPRVVLGLFIGFGLAGAGAVFQGLLRNPLADPFMLGTSSAAAAGVMAANLIGFRHFSALYFSALAFALLSILLVYRIAHSEGKAPIQTMILAGVIVSLFFNAAVYVFFSVFYRESTNALFYLLGSLTESDPLLLTISATMITAGFGVSWFYSQEIDLMSQGEETAFHLGVNVERTKLVLFAAASAMVAAAVAASGLIGFVGLVVPHMMRLVFGPGHRTLIPVSALGGAGFLVLADSLARTAAAPLEIPVGALTALIGSPYFVYLLRRSLKQGEF